MLLSIIAEYNLYIADIQIPYNHDNYNNGIEYIDNSISNLYYHASTLWSISIIIFVINFIIVMNLEIQNLAITRGFQDPLPLSRKSSGWDATNQSYNFYSIFTGTMLIQLPSLTNISFYSNDNNHRIPPRSIYNNSSSRSGNKNSNNNIYRNNNTGIGNNNVNDSKDIDNNDNNNGSSARRLSAKKRDSKRLSRIRNNDNISPSLVASSSSSTDGILADNTTTMITDALATASSRASPLINSSSSSSFLLRQDKEIEMSPIRQSL